MIIPFYEDLAVIFLSELALLDKSRTLSISEISKKHSLSPLFLKKIARMLIHSGFIKSKEGVHGGYNLSIDPTRVTLWDIYSAIDQSKNKQELNAPLNYSVCPVNNTCLPQIIRKETRSAIQKSLQTVSLASLIKKVV